MRLVVRSIFFYCFPSFKRMLVSITFTLSLYSIYSRLFLPCSSFFYFFLSVFALISMLVKSQFLKTIERERERETTHTHKTNTLHDQTDYFFSILGLFLLLRFSCLINEKIDSLVRPLLFSRLSVYDEYCLKKKN